MAKEKSEKKEKKEKKKEVVETAEDVEMGDAESVKVGLIVALGSQAVTTAL